MKLEPVYLVAPERPSLIPTRRAVLFAGLSFFGGAAAGGALGIQYERSKGAPAEDELAPSGDPELDRLRRLAIEAPIDELRNKQFAFITAVQVDYPRDAVLWRGVGRLVDDVLSGEGRSGRRDLARLLASVIRNGAADVVGELAAKRPALEALGR